MNTEETSRRLYPTQHPSSCGIDLHARAMDLCLLNQAGETLLHRHLKAPPAALLQGMAPYRPAIVVAVAGRFPWPWLADLGAAAGSPCVLGPALSRTALHGGKAKHDKLDSHTLAVLLRGGRRPPAYGSPAPLRATRDLRRRRRPRAHNRGERLAHGQPPQPVSSAGHRDNPG